jgi:phytoene/squalene synthetase
MPPITTSDSTAQNEIAAIALAGLPAALHPATAAFYALARLAGGIADDPDMPATRRLALIDALDALLEGRKPEIPLALPVAAAAQDFLREAQTVGGDPRHARHMLQAMRQDCSKSRYRDWPEWLAYCRYAAAPLGRFLLDISGEDKAALPAVEALCCALRLLSHLQDCGADYRALDRVYLPERWLREHGASVENLAAEAADAALFAVFAEALDAVQRLMIAAEPLPGLLHDRRLRMNAATVLSLTRRWAKRLSASDPLRVQVRLGAFDRWIAAACGAWRWLR